MNDVDAGFSDNSIVGLSSDYQAKFTAGAAAFRAKLTATDGLGPLYTKQSCEECHMGGGRGTGEADKMAVVESDGLTPFADQSLLPYGNTEHPNVVSEIPGVHTPIMPPFTGSMDAGSDAGTASIRVTKREGPPVFGRGYMEAIADSEIMRMASLQASGEHGVRGRVNQLTFVSQPNPDSTFDSNQTGATVIGRFGLKARIATLDEFAADALQGDIGATSPMRQTEFKNPDGVTDDLKAGIDVTSETMNSIAMYPRLLDIPPRGTKGSNGKAWFEACTCQVCHVESIHTRADYPVPQLANIDAPVFTDMLLHDMGDDLSDSVTGGAEGMAGPRDWRTAPLIGERYYTSYLHDGRASTIRDAILMHAGNGSEANYAVEQFKNLTPSFQQQVIDFVTDL